MKFTCKGHINILGTHRNTLEFTKDKDLSKNGDCIIGVEADFDITKLKTILKKDKVKIIIKTENHIDELECEINKEFSDEHEIVIRTTDFLSERTLGINATKAAKDIDRNLIEELKDDSKTLEVEII